MKRLLTFVGALLMVSVALLAVPRTSEDAARVAQDFLQRKQVALSPARTGVAGGARSGALTLSYTQMQKDNATPALYVFNNAQSGFVVVSADDRAKDVLGYANEGTFNPDNIPSNVQFWLDMYSREIARAAALPATAAATVASVAYPEVAPLVSARWNQDAPYYDLCPTVGGERTYSGCVATAATQVMYYHKWPVTGTGSHSYTWEGRTLSANFAATTYEWANMLDDYSNGYTTAQGNAVATLMYHAGVACDMQYGTDGSGAYTGDIVRALYTYFGYDAAIRTLPKDYMSQSGMLRLMSEELLAGRPMIVDGATKNGEGHAFVCDGMQADGLIHINWGWGGYCDGYFVLSALDSNDQGIGGAASGEGYTEDVCAYIGIQPDKGGTVAPTMITKDIAWVSDVAQLKTTPIEFTITELWNYGTCTMDGSYGFALYKDGASYIEWAGEYLGSIDAYYGFEDTLSTSVDLSTLSLSDGEYSLSVGIVQDGQYYPIYVNGIGEKLFTFTISGNYVYYGSESRPELPLTPDPAGVDVPYGTLNVYEARELCAELASGETAPYTYYVKGWVDRFHDKHDAGISGYGNALFYIKPTNDGTASEEFLAYQVYGKNGERITDANMVQVGDFVVLCGRLTNYNGIAETVGQGQAYIYSSSNSLFYNTFTIRMRPGADCAMDLPNGLWIWWWNDSETGAFVPTTLDADGWYVAEITTTDDYVSVLGVNSDSWGEQTWDYINVTEDACFSIGGLSDGKYTLTKVDCETGEQEIIEPSFLFTQAEVWSQTYYGTPYMNITLRTSDYLNTFGGFFGTSLSFNVGVKDGSSIIGTYYVNSALSMTAGVIDYAQIEYGKGTSNVRVINDGWLTISLDANGDYVFDYELTDNEGNTYQHKTTISVANLTAYQGGGMFALSNDVITALPASTAKALILTREDNTISGMNYFVEGIISTIASTADNIVSYGNANLYISDDGTTENELYGYRTNWLGNTAFVTGTEVAVGDTAVLLGPWQYYGMWNPEINSGYIYQYRPYVEPLYSAPVNLQATTDDGYHYTFTWEGGEKPAPQYRIRLLYEGYTYHTSYVSEMSRDITLALEGSYTWEVSACDEDGNIVVTTQSEDVLTPTNLPDYSIQNFAIAKSDLTATFSWESPAPLFLISVYDIDNNEMVGEFITSQSYTWTAAEAGTYTVYMGPVNEECTYWLGNQVSEKFTFYTEDPALYAPYDLVATPGNGVLDLSWSANRGSNFEVVLTWSGRTQSFVTQETSLRLNTTGFEDETMSWKVATIDERGNLLSEYVDGPDFVLSANPYEPQDLQAATSDGYTYHFTWGYRSLPSPKYQVVLYDGSGSFYESAAVEQEEWYRIFDTEGTYSWAVYALDADGNAQGYKEGGYFDVTNVPEPETPTYTITTIIPDDCTMDFSNGMWYYWFGNGGWGGYGTVQAEQTTDGKWVGTIVTDEPYINVIVTVQDPLTDSWGPQTHNSPDIYGDTCLIVGLYDYSYGQWYLDARPCDENTDDYLPTNLQVETGVGAATFTWSASVTEQFEILLNMVDAPESVSQYIVSETTLGLVFNDYAVGEWQWRVRALSANYAPLTEFVEGPRFEIKANPYLPYDLRATTQDSATWYLSWSADAVAPMYYVQAGNHFAEYVTTWPVEVTFEEAGYYDWQVRPCDEDGNMIGFVYGPTIYVPSHAAIDYSISNLQVVVAGNSATASWTSGSAEFNVDLYSYSEGRYVYDEFISVPYIRWTDLTAGEYRIYVYAYDQKGTYRGSVYDYFTIEETPEPVQQYSLYITADAGGSVNAVNGLYDAGSLVTIIATPDAGYRFVQWSDGNTEATRTIVITQDIALTASFELIPVLNEYTLTVEEAEGGTTSPTGSVTCKEGDQVTLVAYATVDYTFTTWLIEGVEYHENPLFLTVDRDITVTPVFTKKAPKPTYTLAFTTVGEGSVMVSPEAEAYEEYAIVTLMAIPDDGWRFKAWEDGNTSATRKIVMTSDVNAVATFETIPAEYTLTVNPPVGRGSVTCSPRGYTYEKGTEVTLTATPEEGWLFKEWEDGSTNAVRIVTMTSDITVTATFEEIPVVPEYTLTINPSVGRGSVTCSPKQETYEAGAIVTLTATPEEGWQFKEWEDGSTNAVRTITMTGNITVTATFEEIPVEPDYTIKDLAVATANTTATATWKSDATVFEVIVTRKNEVQVSDTIDQKTYTFKGKAGQTYVVSVRPMDSDKETYLGDAATKQFSFERLYTLWISANAGGSVNEDVNGNYKYGTEVTIVATPNDGYQFDRWSDDNKEATRVITMDDDYYLDAYFTRIPIHSVTIYAATIGGTTDPASGTYTLQQGEILSVEAIPNEGYVFTQWVVNGNVETENPFVIENIDMDYSIEPVFTEEMMSVRSAEVDEKAEKILYNGQLFIRRGDSLYDAQGNKVSE